MSQDDVIAFLSRPETYGLRNPVETITTHISHVFLAGDRVYKLKRAVRFSFVDFTEPAARRRACEDELRLNRRTAPTLYLKVSTVTRASDGTLSLDGAGEPVDWVVVMRRFDQDRLLDRMAQAGTLTRAHVDALAEAIAHFHAEAEVDRSRGGEAAMADTARELEGGLEQHVHAMGALLDRRRDNGFVRRCHGDLHLRNIVLLDGKPTPFDCIEFNDDFAVIDIMYDVAFLLMDLEHRARRDLANAVMNRIIDINGDVEGVALLPLFMAMRAAVRARVAQTQGLVKEHDEFIAVMRDVLTPVKPTLVAIGGLSGSGKSTVARAIAPAIGRAPGALVVRSDTTRKRLAGVALTERLGPEAYTPEASKRVYDTMMTTAETALRGGQSVILDAVFARPEERAAARALARDCGLEFRGIWLDLPLARRRERVDDRVGDASDATAAVATAQESYDLGIIDWQIIDAGQDLKTMKNQILAHM